MKIAEKGNIVVLGAGTMGSGIAQIAATNGHNVTVVDTFPGALDRAKAQLEKVFKRLVEKGKFSREEADSILGRMSFSADFESLSNPVLLIEAIIEDEELKKKEFTRLEKQVNDSCIIATNTSSLSVTALASSLQKPDRFIGLHFFNPAPLMPLVEVVPGYMTSEETTKAARAFVDSWEKTTVLAQDTPGFIVNRIARPFYSEPLRMQEEGIADIATIDWAMREIGGFRMGPFQLMDLIGNDVNYTVTETVWQQMYYDPRFKPSITQKRMKEAGLLGRKTGRGWYDYGEQANNPAPDEDRKLGAEILLRTLSMLINEAADALFLNIASREDIDLAMTKGVNYPKGLLQWADELGINAVVGTLINLFEEYGEDRYRPNPLLKRMSRESRRFYE